MAAQCISRSWSLPSDVSHRVAEDEEYTYAGLTAEQSRGLQKSHSTDCLVNKLPSYLGMSPQLARQLTNSSLGRAVQKHQREIPLWMLFSVVSLCFYHWFSDGDYSFLMTLGSVIGTLSFAVLVLKVVSLGSMAGISLSMMQCYCVLSWMRLSSILFFDSYLPFDRSGDVIYRLAEVVNCGCATYLVCLGMFVPKYAATVVSADDTVKPYYLIAPTLLLALVFHPSLNGNILTDVAWAAALYLECISVLPQLFMFNRQRKVDPSTTHFLAAQALSRLMSFIFWMWTWQELNDILSPHPLKQYVGQWVLIMQAAQLLVMGDFVYSYARALVSGSSLENMLLPTSGGVCL